MALIRGSKSIFISYPSESFKLAEEVSQALTNQGYEVFFDKTTLVAGDDYNDVIRRNIAGSGMMIVLLASGALRDNSYVLSEVNIAKEVWPAAKGKVLPFLIDHTLDLNKLPAYVRSVHIVKVEGNSTAAILAEVTKLAGKRFSARQKMATSVAAAVGTAALGYWLLTPAVPRVATLTNIHFRPSTQPPPSIFEADASKTWLASNATLTVSPVTYVRDGAWKASPRVMKEQVELVLGARTFAFEWLYEVDIKPNCNPWLCRVRDAQPIPIEASKPLSREVMFKGKDGALNWQGFMDYVTDPASREIKLSLSSTVATGGPLGGTTQLVSRCTIPIEPLRAKLKENRFAAGSGFYPPFLQPKCP